MLHVASAYGYKSGPVAWGGKFITTPADIAKQMLWELAKAQEPKPPFFYWR